MKRRPRSGPRLWVARFTIVNRTNNNELWVKVSHRRVVVRNVVTRVQCCVQVYWLPPPDWVRPPSTHRTLTGRQTASQLIIHCCIPTTTTHRDSNQTIKQQAAQHLSSFYSWRLSAESVCGVTLVLSDPVDMLLVKTSNYSHEGWNCQPTGHILSPTSVGNILLKASLITICWSRRSFSSSTFSSSFVFIICSCFLMKFSRFIILRTFWSWLFFKIL